MSIATPSAMQRLSLFLIPALIAIGLFMAISSFDPISNDSVKPLDRADLYFDAYSEGINTVLYARDGTVHYTLQAISQTHYNNNVRTDLEKPFIRLYQQGDSRWNIVANSGRISATLRGSEAAHLIELSGNVEVFSIDEFGNRTVLSTEFLSLDLDMETLETDQAVTLVTTNLKQSSIGMFADLGSDEIFFRRDNKGSYEQMSN